MDGEGGEVPPPDRAPEAVDRGQDVAAAPDRREACRPVGQAIGGDAQERRGNAQGGPAQPVRDAPGRGLEQRRPSPLQAPGHLGRAAEAVPRPLGQRLGHHEFHPLGHARPPVAETAGFLAKVHQHQVHGGRVGKGIRAGQALVQQDAELVDVRPDAELQPLDLLGRQVERRADDLAHRRGLLRVADLLGQAEVQDLHLARPVGHDVRRLQVAVDDPRRVQARHRLQDCAEQGAEFIPGIGAFRLQPLFQGAAGDALHDREPDAAPALQGVDADDARIADAARQGGLPLHAQELFLVAQRLRVEEFQSHRDLQGLVGGGEDQAEAPLADQPLHPAATVDHGVRLQACEFQVAEWQSLRVLLAIAAGGFSRFAHEGRC